MNTYKVLEILEADFGCEGRMEGVPVCDEVKLMNVQTEEISKTHIPDAELYEKEIEEGTLVTWENQIIMKI